MDEYESIREWLKQVSDRLLNVEARSGSGTHSSRPSGKIPAGAADDRNHSEQAQRTRSVLARDVYDVGCAHGS
jgi:hypothetical protein